MGRPHVVVVVHDVRRSACPPDLPRTRELGVFRANPSLAAQNLGPSPELTPQMYARVAWQRDRQLRVVRAADRADHIHLLTRCGTSVAQPRVNGTVAESGRYDR